MEVKWHCEECSGTGEIPCPGCDGCGEGESDIETVKLERNMENYEELLEFQNDAKRVIKQAARLRELKPNRSESYNAQLRATLWIINKQADKASDKKLVSAIPPRKIR